MESTRYQLHIQYDGSSYAGWQEQPNAITIQQTIQHVLSTLFNQSISIVGSGRTDAGVHASAQVAHFDAPIRKPEKLLAGLQGLLPYDIRIPACFMVDSHFHARFTALRRQYIYYLYQDTSVPPWFQRYMYHIKPTFSIEKLDACLQFLIGEHDFSAFCATGGAEQNKIRTIESIQVESTVTSPIIRTIITGNAFLRKMIRMIMGAAIGIVKSDGNPDQMNKILQGKTSQHGFPTLAPDGLFLTGVWYPKPYQSYSQQPF